MSNNTNCSNVTESYNNVWNNWNILLPDEKLKVLEWLSPLTSRERHQTVRDVRADGVGEWLLHTKEFSSWRTSEERAAKPVLLCYGSPGVGKTYISSLVIDTLSGGTGKDNAAVAYVYCDYSAQDAQSAKTVLASVLKQAVGSLAQIPDEVQSAFERAKRQIDGCGLLLKDIGALLAKSVSNLEPTFICIDALDEFPQKQRPELWQSLQRLIRECPNIRLFLTGRHHIKDEAVKYFPETAEMLHISPHADDIELYLKMRLDQDPEPSAMDEGLRTDILRVIPARISGIFLLVCINMDAVLAEATIYQRRQALDRMTKGLGLQDAYKTTLDRIRKLGGSKEKLGMQALMWISNSGRPLGSEEFCHALGVELGANDFNSQNVPSIQTALSCTLGLVTLDEKQSQVRLLHQTLQEYLNGHSEFVTAHSMMAETCLTYLNSESVRALPSNPDNARTIPPFLAYAACFWGTHAAMEVTETVKSLALRLLDGYEDHVSATIFWRRKIHQWYSDKDVQGISGLHCIAFWGIPEIARAMLEAEKWDMYGQDSKGDTPLGWAMRHGNKRVAELFLERRDLEPNKVVQGGRTVFSFAAELGNEHIVRLLLECGDASPDSADEHGRTPLSHAAESEQESIVKLLLERRDVNPNSADRNGTTPLAFVIIGCWDVPSTSILKLFLERADVNLNLSDESGQTPLSLAVQYEFEDIVELLLKSGRVNPNLADNDGKTPLLYALHDGEVEGESVVKLLLECKNVDPNLPDSDGRTPLSFAVEYGFEDIVELLLKSGRVNPNLADKDGRTPLLYVWQDCEVEYEGVVNLLLECKDVDPNLAGSDGRTPLSFAAEYGFNNIVELLLKSGRVNPNLADKDGQTPLLYALEDPVIEDEDVVKLLLECKDVDPNRPDSDGRTPLSFAVEYGFKNIVELLLKSGRVNPNLADNDGKTPLSFAASGGHEGVVTLLLEREDVNPDSPDSNGRTPLSFAASEGHEGVANLLLAREDVDHDSPDSDGRTPLSFAASCGHAGVANLLLERGDVNPNSPCSNGGTPLLFAAAGGHEGVVSRLLEREDVNPDSPNSNGRTPLSFAAAKGHESVVKLLLDRKDVNPNSPDSNGRTPLSFAASGGHEGVLLLERDEVDPNLQDTNGRTPLSYAAWVGLQSVVKLLLEHKDVNPDSPYYNGRTPLSFAAEWGYEGAVRLLLDRTDVNPDSLDNNSRTPLSFAAESGHEGVVKLLLDNEGVNPNRLDDDHLTPLSYATRHGHQRVLNLLSDYVNPGRESSEAYGQTESFVGGEKIPEQDPTQSIPLTYRIMLPPKQNIGFDPPPPSLDLSRLGLLRNHLYRSNSLGQFSLTPPRPGPSPPPTCTPD